MRRYLLPLVIVLMACVAPASAAADSRVTGVIGGPSTVQRGQEAVYTVTLRNAGTQTLGTGSPRLAMDLDSIPSSGARLTDAVQVGGTGPWTCGSSGCTLGSGVSFPPGATASFAVLVKVFRSTTLDLDVTGNEVSFSNVRRSIRTSGTLVPVLYGLSMPATISPRTGPVGFTLSEPARVTVRLERISTRWRLRKRVRGGVVRSIRCADRRPKVRRTTLVRRGRTRCSLGIRTLGTSPTRARGFNLLDVPQLRSLPAGQRYRLRLRPRTSDGRQGREAKGLVLKTTR